MIQHNLRTKKGLYAIVHRPKEQDKLEDWRKLLVLLTNPGFAWEVNEGDLHIIAHPVYVERLRVFLEACSLDGRWETIDW